MGLSTDRRQCDQKSHIVNESRNPPDQPLAGLNSTIRRIVNWFTPYTMAHYPGRYGVWRIMTPGYAAKTVKHFTICHQRPPAKILLHWAELAEAHARAGLEIAADLRAAAAALQARPPHAGTANLRRYRLKKRSTTTL